LVEARGERGEELALPDAPLRGAAQGGVAPVAVGAAEEAGTVPQGANDVRHAREDLQRHERQDQPWAGVPPLHLLQSQGLPPRRAASPRSSRAMPAPTAALIEISKMASSDQPARRTASMSPSGAREA